MLGDVISTGDDALTQALLAAAEVRGWRAADASYLTGAAFER